MFSRKAWTDVRRGNPEKATPRARAVAGTEALKRERDYSTSRNRKMRAGVSSHKAVIYLQKIK